MLSGARTLLTLAVLALLVVLAGAWGWAKLTAPLPKKEPAPVCTAATVKAGDHVFPAQVTVSVLNASRREGLAGRTMSSLTTGGFGAGDSGNAPKGTSVSVAQIWTPDPSSPAVALVKAWLPGVKVVRRQVTEPGVVVVVGDKFKDVGQGPKSITATKDATICSPALS
jgi:hypothetical protein